MEGQPSPDVVRELGDTLVPLVMPPILIAVRTTSLLSIALPLNPLSLIALLATSEGCRPLSYHSLAGVFCDDISWR